MKTSLQVSSLALAWSQCLGSQDTPPLSQQSHMREDAAWWKQEGAKKSGTGVEAKKLFQAATSDAEATHALKISGRMATAASWND